MESFRRYVAVSGGQEALAGGLGELGRGHGTGLRPAEDAGVHRGGQAGVVERRGAQGVVGEGVVRAAPTFAKAHCMRAWVLIGKCSAWNAGPRSAVELTAAAAHFDRAAALFNAPAAKASLADVCRAVLLPEVRTLLEPITSLTHSACRRSPQYNYRDLHVCF